MPKLDLDDAHALLRERLKDTLSARAYPKTICPSEVARALTREDLQRCGATEWRDVMEMVRDVAYKMREAKELEVLQGGRVIEETVHRNEIRGPIRLRTRDTQDS